MWVKTDALQSFAAANAAVKALPFEFRYRVQLMLSLEALSTKPNVRIEKNASDRAYNYALTASPHHPIIQVMRGQYLINSGRWKEGLKEISENLQRSHRKHPQSWMIVAVYESMVGHTDKAAKALEQGLIAGGSFDDMQRIANQINMEIEKQ